MKITYSAWLGDKLGLSTEEICLPAEVMTVADLITWLSRRGPEFDAAFEFAEVIKVVVNQEFAHNDQPVSDDDDVIFFPPISGG